MTNRTSIFGGLGMALGGLALITAVVAHWAGPFAPEATLTQSMSESAAAIRDAIMAEIGEQPAEPPRPFYDDWTIDRSLTVAAATAGGLGVLLGFIGLARKEDYHVVVSAVLLGALTLIFQLVVGMS